VLEVKNAYLKPLERNGKIGLYTCTVLTGYTGRTQTWGELGNSAQWVILHISISSNP
jgi:hypothetical protein